MSPSRRPRSERPAQHRPIRVVPMRGVGGLVAPATRVAAPPAAQLTYRGGPLLTAVEVVTVYWGAAWNEPTAQATAQSLRSEEHTSELQSRRDLVCRLLLEKKKKKASGTADDHDAHVTPAIEIVEGRTQRDEHRRVHGIALVRAIHRDGGDVIGDLREHLVG